MKTELREYLKDIYDDDVTVRDLYCDDVTVELCCVLVQGLLT